MKKYFSLVLCLVVSMFVFNANVNAASKVSTLPEAVEEEIGYFGDSANFEDKSTFAAYAEYVDKLKKFNAKDYSESDNKVNVYIFRCKTCWHCLDEVSWLAENYNKYAEYINVHTYEVWNDTTNSKLMNLVAKHLGKKASGVPFTVIGDQTFSGFSEELGESMMNVAKDLYESSSKYDIKDYIDLENVQVIKEDDKKSSSNAVMILLIAAVLLGGGALIFLISKSK